MGEKAPLGAGGGDFSNPDISDPFGMWRFVPPPTPCLAKTVESVIIFKARSRSSTRFETTKDIGVDFALWAKKLCQKAEESFNGLKRESATD